MDASDAAAWRPTGASPLGFRIGLPRAIRCSAREKSKPRNAPEEIFMRGAAEIARQAVSTANRMQRELAQPRNSAIKLGVAIRPIDKQYQFVSFWLPRKDSNSRMQRRGESSLTFSQKGVDFRRERSVTVSTETGLLASIGILPRWRCGRCGASAVTARGAV